MNVDILGLEAFLAIAQHGHFTNAARSLHITQTALTRRLQHFEEGIGVSLVERTTRSVSLGNDGRFVAAPSQRAAA